MISFLFYLLSNLYFAIILFESGGWSAALFSFVFGAVHSALFFCFSSGNSIPRMSANAFKASYSVLPFSASRFKKRCISSFVISSICSPFSPFEVLPSFASLDNTIINYFWFIVNAFFKLFLVYLPHI